LPNTDATPKTELPPVQVPKDLQSNKFVQLLLISLEYQTQRAENEKLQRIQTEGQLIEMQKARDEWKNNFWEERKATAQLQISLSESRNETAQVRIANEGFLRQRELDKQFISDQSKEIKQLRRSRWKYAAGGFIAGFATGFPTGVFVSMKFNF